MGQQSVQNLKMPSLREEPSAGLQTKAVTSNPLCENVLLGEGYRTPHEVMTGEYGAVMERI
jgi:hypothetical protein